MTTIIYSQKIGHTKLINIILYVPELAPLTIITGSDDNDIKIWTALSYQEKFILKGHIGYITSIIYLGNNTLASTAGDKDKTLRIWDIPKMGLNTIVTTSKIYKGYHISSMLHVKNYNEDLIMLGSSDDPLRLFNFKTGEVIKKYDRKTKYCLRIIDLNFIQINMIVFANKDKIKFFNIETCQFIKSLEEHKERIQTMSYFKRNESNYIISGGWDRMVIIWDIDKYQKILGVIGHDSWIRNIIVLDNNYIFIYGTDKFVRLVELKLDEKELKLLNTYDLENMNLHMCVLLEINKDFNKKICVCLNQGQHLKNYCFKVNN